MGNVDHVCGSLLAAAMVDGFWFSYPKIQANPWGVSPQTASKTAKVLIFFAFFACFGPQAA